MRTQDGVSILFGLGVWLTGAPVGVAHGDLHDRIAAASTRIAGAPQDGRHYLERAELFREHEEWAAALADCDAAERLDPALGVGLLRAGILLESGHGEDALPVIDGVLGRRPGDLQALVWRARIYDKLGRGDEAAKDYSGVLGRTPAPEPDLVREYAEVLVRLGKLADALRVLGEGMDKLGRIPSLMVRAIELEVMTGNIDGALARVEVMRQHAPRPEPWMAKRASVLAQAGRLDESRQAWHDLARHLGSLPDAERDSHAMSRLLVQTKQALASLESMTRGTNPPPSPTTNPKP